MELKKVVELLHQECNSHFKNHCLDCELSKNYLCQDVLKMKNLNSEKIEKIENICNEIIKKSTEKE